MSGGRVAVVGDVGGHLDELRRELARLGADARTGQLPPELTVVQVGDLVHRGPDSDGVLALVDRYLTEQTDQWVQLVGNHEAQYLRPPAFAWPERVGAAAEATLRRWWASGSMRAAAAVRSGGESLLVTHAGLTEGFWRAALDGPPSAALAAAAINSFAGGHDDVLFHAGSMLGGGTPDPNAGPVWAAAGPELVAGWVASGATLPFSQVHGHSRLLDRRGRPAGGVPLPVPVQVDAQRCHEVVTLPGGRIVGVDAGHGRRPQRRWQALVLDDATVEA